MVVDLVMSNNLIFLDIDGVMNMYGSSSRTFMKPYGQHIEPHLTQRLNYICEIVPNLEIVISSSWRSDMEDLQKQMIEQGFKYWHKVIGKTPQAYREHLDYDKPAKILLDSRGEQIRDWIIKNEYDGTYLVIDDEISDIIGECKIPKFRVYQTDSNEGMLHKDAIAIINYFNDSSDIK